MIKKIFSFLLLLMFFCVSTNLTYALSNNENITKQLILSKAKIKKFKDGNKYILQLNKIDKFIDNQNNVELLTKLKTKVDDRKNKVIPVILGGNSSNDLTYELLNYISLIIDKKIDSLNTVNVQNSINLLNNPELSPEEIKKVEDEIIKLQLNLLDSSKIFLDKLVNDLQKSLNVEESGNLKLNIDGSGAMFGSAKGELSIKDYQSKTANFDSEFKAQIDLLIDSSIKGIPALKTQFSTFLDFITTDGNYYLLLDKLQYSGIDNKEINTYLEKLKELAKNNEYLKYEDKEGAKYVNLIKNFDLNNIYSQTNKILLNPMLKPYKKVGDKYLLLPTKDACDAIKGIEYKIKGNGNWYCSDSEYNDLLKETIKSGNLYIIVDGSDKHLGYEISDNTASGNIKIYSSDKKIEKLLARFEPKDQEKLGEYAEMIFINGQKLDLTLDAKSDDILFSFKSILTSNNKFNKIDYIGNFNKDFTSTFSLENNKFNGVFNTILKKYNYNYETGSSVYEKSGELKGNLNGELNSENSISSFDIKIDGNSSNDKYVYDNENGKYNTKKIDSVFKLNYNLKNEIIDGVISYKEDNSEIVSIKSNGKYKNEYFELNNILNIVNPISKKDNITGKINTLFDGNINRNNFNIYFDIYSSFGYMKMDMKSDYSRTNNPNIKITTPTKYSDMDEVFGKTNINNEFFR